MKVKEADKLRVYVGVDPSTMIPFRVLSHSITSRTSHPVEIVPMLGDRWKYCTDGLKCGTAFSLCRWLIPEYQNWQGLALYMDADTVCLADIAELVELIAPTEPTGGEVDPVVWCTVQPDRHSKKRRVQTSVMVIDCVAAAGWWGFRAAKMLSHLRADATNYTPFMRADWLDGRVGELPPGWNSLDRLAKDTRVLHYTNVQSQAWSNLTHPHRDLWEEELASAIRAGAVPFGEFASALEHFQVKHRDKYGQRGLHSYYARYRSLYL